MDSQVLSPIAVIAFNRADTLKATIDSLAANPLANMSDLFIFIDGPRANKEGEVIKVQQVRAVAESANGFKSVTIRESEYNKGLAQSIIEAASELVNQYGTVIVVEDDLYLSPSFLTYMNIMLQAYKDDKRVMQITGYSTKIRHPKRFDCDHYLTHRAHSWSWGTWKDRWKTIDWEVKDFDELVASKEKQKSFCEYGSDLYKMLRGWKYGRNNSWFIRFNYSMHKQGRFSVAPIRSLVRNDGFGGDATNCKNYNRYKIEFQTDYKEKWDIPVHLEWDKKLDKESVRFWSIPYRIFGKIMTNIKRYISRQGNINCLSKTSKNGAIKKNMFV